MGLILVAGDAVRNLQGAPGIIEDLFANLPAYALPGTIFISTDTTGIYRFNGATWDQKGGGGGVAQSWQDTLLVSSLLTQDNVIDGGGFDLSFQNSSSFLFENSGTYSFGLSAINNFSVDAKNINLNGGDGGGDVIINNNIAGTQFRMDNTGNGAFSVSGNMVISASGTRTAPGQLYISAASGGLLLESVMGGTSEVRAGDGGGDVLLENVAAVSHFQLAASGYTELVTTGAIQFQTPGTLTFIIDDAISIVSGTSAVFGNTGAGDTSINSSNNILMGSTVATTISAGDTLNMFSSGNNVDISGFTNMDISAVNGTFNISAGVDVIMSSINAIDILAGGDLVLSAGGVNAIQANNIFTANQGIIIPVGAAISFPTSTAPGTNALALPANVYGSTATLMGAPSDWILVNVGGNIRKIPAYT